MEALLVSILAIGVLGVAVVQWRRTASRRLRRAVAAARSCAMADVADGETVKLVGHARARRPLRAPLTDRPCVCWQVVIRRRSEDRVWRVILDEVGANDFELEEDGASACIEVGTPRALLDRDVSFHSGPFQKPQERLEAFLELRGMDARGRFFFKDLEYQEGIVADGAPVAVVGVARREIDPERLPVAADDYREVSHPTRLVVRGSARDPLILSSAEKPSRDSTAP